MDKSRNNLIKSKSSNGATAAKIWTRRDKKSRSNVEIKPLALKKRGVYVEKKPTKISLNGPSDNVPNSLKTSPQSVKARTITSVLDILPKNSAGTQCSATTDINLSPNCVNNINKPKIKKSDGVAENVSMKKKHKFRSRVLNRQIENDNIVVLKSRKHINQTPSDYSVQHEPERLSIFLPRFQDTVQDEDMSRTAGNAESVTPVGDITNKDDKKLYNFFVDLLVTTFNVCDVKTEFNKAVLNSANSSKNNFKIDEAVAKKLKMVKRINKSGDSRDAYLKKKSSLITSKDKKGEIVDNVNQKKSVSPIHMSNRKRRLKPITFDNKKKSSKILTQSYNYEKQLVSNKKASKKDRKKHLLNLLKEELKMDSDSYMEPHNFFQALELMVKNKRRCQAPPSLNDSTRKASQETDYKCKFKRRHLLSRSGKKAGISPPNSKKSFRSYQ